MMDLKGGVITVAITKDFNGMIDLPLVDSFFGL